MLWAITALLGPLQVLAAALAVNAEPAPAAGVITTPQWLRTPTYDEVMRLYPERALRLRWEGSGQVRCVHRQGRLDDCEVVSEAPEGRGFGQGAVRVAKTYVMQPGAPDGGFVDLSIAFTIRPEWLATYCPTLRHDEVRTPPAGGFAICMERSNRPRTGPGK